MLASDCHSPFPWRVPLCREQVKRKNHEQSTVFNKRRHNGQFQIVILGTRRCGAKKLNQKPKKSQFNLKNDNTNASFRLSSSIFFAHTTVLPSKESPAKKRKIQLNSKMDDTNASFRL